MRLAQAGNQAETDNHELVITLRSDRPKWWQESVVHELLHCLALHTQLVDEWGDKDEGYVARLAAALYMVITDNPEIIAYWAED